MPVLGPRVIRVLAAFCTDEQLQYSTLLVPEQRFVPDMYLQGLDEMPLQDDLFEYVAMQPPAALHYR